MDASVDLMKVMVRARGHDHLQKFNPADIATWKKQMAGLSGIQYGGVGRRD